MCSVPSVHLVFILKWITMLCRRILKMLICSFLRALEKWCVWCDFVKLLQRRIWVLVCACVNGRHYMHRVHVGCGTYIRTHMCAGRRETKTDDWDWNVPRICDYIQNDIQCVVLGWFGCALLKRCKHSLKQFPSTVVVKCSHRLAYISLSAI